MKHDETNNRLENMEFDQNQDSKWNKTKHN